MDRITDTNKNITLATTSLRPVTSKPSDLMQSSYERHKVTIMNDTGVAWDDFMNGIMNDKWSQFYASFDLLSFIKSFHATPVSFIIVIFCHSQCCS